MIPMFYFYKLTVTGQQHQWWPPTRLMGDVQRGIHPPKPFIIKLERLLPVHLNPSLPRPVCMDGLEPLINKEITIIFPLKLCHLITILWSNILSTCFIYNQVDNEYREITIIVIWNGSALKVIHAPQDIQSRINFDYHQQHSRVRWGAKKEDRSRAPWFVSALNVMKQLLAI